MKILTKLTSAFAAMRAFIVSIWEGNVNLTRKMWKLCQSRPTHLFEGCREEEWAVAVDVVWDVDITLLRHQKLSKHIYVSNSYTNYIVWSFVSFRCNGISNIDITDIRSTLKISWFSFRIA